MTTNIAPAPSISAGPPLSEEPGLGALTLPGFLREVTSMYGDREALVFHSADGATRWTYDELWERAVQVAAALRASGVGKDTRVGLLMTNRPEWLAAFFGISMAGGVAVALSTFSTPAELEYLLTASNVALLLFERQVLKTDFLAVLSDLVPELGQRTSAPLQSEKFPFLRELVLVGQPGPGADDWATFLASGARQPRQLVLATAEAVNLSDAGALFFSSGSTSKPKGILNAHRGITIQMWRFRRVCGFEPGDNIRCWSANGFFWSGNFVMSLGATLAAGGCLVLQPTFVAAEALELMASERVNYPFAWPHQWAQIEAAPNWHSVDLSSMRFADVKTPVARHPTVSHEWHLPDHAYGNTETFTITTIFDVNASPEQHIDSWGVALPGVTLKVVDPVTGDVVPRGTSGEICVKGPTLMLGYIGTPLDETLDSEGFFHTGDGGHLDEAGRLFWTGRLTEIIKTGGANVSPLEVDEILARHPAVKVAKTVGVGHETLGEVVVACVVAHQDSSIEAEEIRTFLREHLASYKVPRHVLFFHDDDISLTGSDKVRVGKLRELAAAKLQSQQRSAPVGS
ncbi:class I adenylate-forming enzyme family protein [Mycobacterium sp. 852014-50255_SCH5639931]|uniref:class I adenylate-forming enzyme family protein n=1 Tax=Mycobacterium sp. 852014-50255_SCH5639931 TaxID=1834112 RepID=UPI000801E89E|nr:class I adenylate-forming enzyme family protein [Mycobacterium sp. 852014-50255_SCH5639931]OBB69136.1 AMP-dependent synthetase [Mycobacterium sp. 852014-50255_SCH5639931]